MKKNKDLVATGLCVLIVGFTIVGKIVKTPQVMAQMQVLGLAEELYLLTIIETVALGLYALPKTTNLGFFLLTAYYGGAIAVNLNVPSNTIPAMVFLAIVWGLTFWKNPGLFLSKTNRP